MAELSFDTFVKDLKKREVPHRLLTNKEREGIFDYVDDKLKGYRAVDSKRTAKSDKALRQVAFFMPNHGVSVKSPDSKTKTVTSL